MKVMLWRRAVGRYGKRGALVAFGLPLAILIGGGASYAMFVGGGHGPAATVNSADLQKGLVGWWKLDGDAKDSSPYGDNGTLNGSPTLTSDREGRANSAYTFNGTNQYISYGTSNIPTLAQFSASAWVYINGDGSSGINGIMDGKAFRFFLRNSTNDLETQINGVTPYDSAVSVAVPRGQWVNIAFSYDGANRQYYINGSLVATVASTGTPSNTDVGEIGSIQGTAYAFNGSMDDVRLYSRALSASEFSLIYHSYSDPFDIAQGENGLVGWWKMDGNANDSTPYGDNGTVSGATLTTDRHGQANSAYSFNGTSNYIRVASLANVPASTMTICAWLKTSSSSYQDIVQLGRNPTDATTEFVWYVNGGKLGFWDYGSNYGFSTTGATSTGTVNDGNWHLGCFVKNETAGTFYIDGAASGTATAAVNATYSSNDFVIGEDYRSISNFFNGSIGDIRLYNRALSQTDVYNLYNSYNSEVCIGGCGISSTVNLQKGLVGYWPMNGNAIDATPYSNNAIVNGATLTNDREGRSNSAFAFNAASSQYISVADSAPLRLGTGDFTISCWVLFPLSGSLSWEGVVSKGFTTSAPANTWGLVRASNRSNGISYQDSATAGSFNANMMDSSVSNGWHLISITRTGGVYYMYVDGSLYTSQTVVAANLSTTTPLLFGSAGGRYLTGSVDEVRIYNRALSATEVQALYREYQ